MTRRRAYLLVVALGLAGMSAVGMLNTARRDEALRDFDWGSRVVLGNPSFVANRVRIEANYDSNVGSFRYHTGAHSPGSGAPSGAPQAVIAEGAHGSVRVRLRAFAAHERAEDEAEEIARAVSFATTRVWPREPTPVEVDVYLMPDDVPFSLARRVDWREGDTYPIVIFARERSFGLETAAHELYHALAGRWSVGTRDPENGARPRAALAYEEAAAALFTLCGSLLANASLPRAALNATLAIDEQRYEDALSGEELAAALDLLSREVPGSNELGPFIADTVLGEVFGGQEAIALESPQGEQLVSRCRESAANPMRLEFRLVAILSRDAAQTERRGLSN